MSNIHIAVSIAFVSLTLRLCVKNVGSVFEKVNWRLIGFLGVFFVNLLILRAQPAYAANVADTTVVPPLAPYTTTVLDVGPAVVGTCGMGNYGRVFVSDEVPASGTHTPPIVNDNIAAYTTAADRTLADLADDHWRAQVALLGPPAYFLSGPVAVGSGQYVQSLNTGNVVTFSLRGVTPTAADDPANLSMGVTTTHLQIAYSGATLQSFSPKPASQHGSGFASFPSRDAPNRDAILMEFSQPVPAFGGWLGDFETNPLGALARVRLFYSDGSVATLPVSPTMMPDGDPAHCGLNYGNPSGVKNADPIGCGNETTRWIGFNAPACPVNAALFIVGDNDPGDNGNTEVLSFIGDSALPPDVALTKQAPSTAFVNGSFNYTLRVNNLGGHAATNVVVTDTQPAGVVFNSVTPASMCALVTGGVVCQVGVLPGNDHVDIVINATASGVGTTINTAQVTAAEDSDMANNAASASTVVSLPPLVPAGYECAGPALVINEVHYRGLATTTNEYVELFARFDIPAGTSFFITDNEASATSAFERAFTLPVGGIPAGTYVLIYNDGSRTNDSNAVVNGIITYFIGNGTATLNNTGDNLALYLGTQITGIPLDYVAYGVGAAVNAPPAGLTWSAPTPAATTGQIIQQTNDGANTDAGGAWSSVPTGNTTPGSTNTGSVMRLPVCAAPELGVQKTVTPIGVVHLGDVLTYTLIVSNAGMLDANPVNLTDTLPVGLSYQTDSAGCTLDGDGAMLSCNLGLLPSGQQTTVVVLAQITALQTSPTILTNTAQVSTTGDVIVINNTAFAISTVVAGLDVTVHKTAPLTGSVGQPLTYTIQLTNASLVSSGPITVLEQLPPEVTYVGFSGAPFAQDSGPDAANQVTFTLLAGLPINATATLNIVVLPSATEALAEYGITNQVQIVALGDSVVANNNSSATSFIDDLAPTATPTPMPSDTPTATPTMTPTPTDTASSTPTSTSTSTPTPTALPISTDMATPTATDTPNPTVTATSTASSTPTLTPSSTQAPTALPTTTDTATPTATDTPNPTATATSTASSTPTATPTPTQTPTVLPTATETATPTATDAPNPTVTATSTASSTSTATPTPTQTPTALPTATETAIPTTTDTPNPTTTATSTASSTPAPTSTALPISTDTATPTAWPTFTDTPTPAVTPVPIVTETPEASAVLQVSKASMHSGVSVFSGDLVTYTIQVTNVGAGEARLVVISDPLPEGLAYVSDSANPALLSADGNVLKWAMPMLAASRTYSVSFAARVTIAGAGGRTQIVNTAYAAAQSGRTSTSVVQGEDEARLPIAPTAILLKDLSAEWQDAGAVITWETGQEYDTFGFLIYRGERADYASAVQLSRSVIPSKSVNGGGATYAVLDTSAASGHTYFYWLVEMEQDGDMHPYGPVRMGDTMTRMDAITHVYLPAVSR